MKTAAASVINASAPSPSILNRIRNTSAFFRKLSLKAEKNWHQNRGAKRRVLSRENIASPNVRSGVERLRSLPHAHSKDRTIWAKRQAPAVTGPHQAGKVLQNQRASLGVWPPERPLIAVTLRRRGKGRTAGGGSRTRKTGRPRGH